MPQISSEFVLKK